ncbi:hypothetical protein GGR51DRAFT_516129 [Nemania sp. FL0031]|nr:hypothetical protein GGR51DRAFT_516129 [Nemania sp. FL0031]
MASFIDAAIRLALRRKPGEGQMADEHAQDLAGRRPGEQPVLIPAGGINANANGGANPIIAGAADRHHHGQVYINPEEDPLTFFRLMLGIQTTPYLGFTLSSPLGTRPAANIGLYARVVHSEQKAKDSFKVFSVVINGCYFLQIVIAAALTALGAARASSGAVTAFGALNTVIAGFLTFLKGSGLPGRLKYYGNEWKKIREYIEQRERDFMRGAGAHSLDVYEVVDTIEKMYNNLKADIELNTPDSYTSPTNQRRVGDSSKDTKIGGIDISKLETLATKLKGFENGGGKLDALTSGIAKKAEDAEKRIHEHGRQMENEVEHLKEDVVRDVQNHQARARAAITEGKQAARDGVEDRRTRLENAAGEQHARALETISDTGRAAQEGIDSTASHVTGSIGSLVREISDIHRTAVSEGRSAAAQQIRSLAQRLAHHDEKPEERRPEGGSSEK